MWAIEILLDETKTRANFGGGIPEALGEIGRLLAPLGYAPKHKGSGVFIDQTGEKTMEDLELDVPVLSRFGWLPDCTLDIMAYEMEPMASGTLEQVLKALEDKAKGKK